MLPEDSHKTGVMNDARSLKEGIFRGRGLGRCCGASVSSRECMKRDLGSNPVMVECGVRDE
jgi:hypothetical protein